MTESRCGALLLGCSIFVAFTLVSDAFWASGHSDGAATATSVGGESAGMFKGEWRLTGNGTMLRDGITGSLRVRVLEKVTSAQGVRVVELILAFFSGEPGEVLATQEILLQGLDFHTLGTLSLTGVSDPGRFTLFGLTTCRLKAMVDVQGENLKSITGEVLSSECGFQIHFSGEEINMKQLVQKVSHYSIWTNLLTLVQMRCYITQMRHTDDGPSALKVSIICIGWQALMDAYDSFLHLCLGLASQYMFNTFAVISLFKFVLFSFLGMRYLLTLWKSRRRDIFAQGWEAIRREVSWLYSRFYGLLIVGIVLLYNSLQYLHLVAIASQAYWVPQIVHDAHKGTRHAINPSFLLGISISRCLLPMYVWGCPFSIFSGEIFPRLPGAPSATLCSAFVIVQAVQMAVMFSQQAFGPRWFVPWACLPGVYNYYRPTAGLDEEGGRDCVICMCEVTAEDRTRVVTPCDHHFHRSCLTEWMEVKMECPTCRTEIPPID